MDTDAIKKYIFQDVFDYFIDAGVRNERDRYLQQTGLINKAFIYPFVKFFTLLLDTIYKIKLKNNTPNKQGVYFYADPTIYSEIVYELSHSYNLYFNNPLRVDKRIRFRENVYYFPFVDNARRLTRGFLNGRDDELHDSLRRLKASLEIIKPKFIVLNDSTLPINRAIILISKELGIYTIEVQHAIYPSEMKILPGLGTDFVYVWGNYFKNMYEDQKIRASGSLKLIGYPFKSNLTNRQLPGKRITLYYLAQGFQYQDIKNLDRLLENALYLKNLASTLNMTFKCKLHPNSPKILLDMILPQVECNPLKQTMKNAIEDGDIFVSFNSTALIEAAFQGKKCYQLLNLPVECDNFEELGVCETFLSLSDLESHLTSLVENNNSSIFFQKSKINSHYIETFSCGPGKRFVNLLQEV